MKTIVFLIFMGCFGVNLSQNTFHKTYLYDSTNCLFSSVFVTDSGYYVSGGLANHPYYRGVALFTRLDVNGNPIQTNIHSVPGVDLRMYYTTTKPQLNYRGNITYSFAQKGITGAIPRFMEYNLDGTIVLDIQLDTLFKDSLIVFDNGTIIPHNSDSSYFILFTYYDEKTSFETSDYEAGVVLMKLNHEGKILFIKYFEESEISIPSRGVANVHRTIHVLPNNNILIVFNRRLVYGDRRYNRGRTDFIELTSNGEMVLMQTFQDSQNDLFIPSGILLPNGEYLMSYFHGIPENPTQSNTLWLFRSSIVKLDSNKEAIWKDFTNDTWGTERMADAPADFEVVDDTAFICAFTNYVAVDEHYDFGLQIQKRTLDKGPVWERKIRYFPQLVSPLSAIDYTIIDIESTADKGLIFVGELVNNDSLQANRPGQYGYALKTNCLGFLGKPQANFTTTVSENKTVTFVNTSSEAGSYIWDFGGGTTLTTSENVDTVYHVYNSIDQQTVTLIANGCNGEADTSSITFIPIKTPPISTSEGNYFTVFPNPVISGDLITVFIANIDLSQTTLLQIHDASGRLISKLQVTDTEAYYVLPHDIGSGTYTISLIQNETVLQTQKINVL